MKLRMTNTDISGKVELSLSFKHFMSTRAQLDVILNYFLLLLLFVGVIEAHKVCDK